MFYIGMDVHGKWTRIEGFDPDTGETVSFPKVPNDPGSLREVFSALEGPIHAAMEIGLSRSSAVIGAEPAFHARKPRFCG